MHLPRRCLNLFRPVLLALVAGALLVTPAPLEASKRHWPERDFPRYSALDSSVGFWRDVFSKYTSRQLVIHDLYRLDLVYAISDVSDILDGPGTPTSRARLLSKRIDSEERRVADLLDQLASREPENEEERRVAKMLGREGVPAAKDLAGRVRAQRGLGDALCAAVDRARPWLPEMRRILRRYDVPADLVYLPLVESSYRNDARSYLGAVGVWQFTRSTGRRFLHVDHVVDERRDTLRATEAAAKYLRENYKRLGNWPLAVTAYNYGAAGVDYAVRRLGTKDLPTIIAEYKSRRFGFASRNFYSEFLAAIDVMERGQKQCRSSWKPAASYDSVELSDFVAFDDLVEVSGTPKTELARLNPALQADVIAGKLYVPRGYTLTLPNGTKGRFTGGYSELAGDKKQDRQIVYYASHRVRRGQTLSHIARDYRTTVRRIAHHNDIRDPRRLRYGQVLKIPVGDARTARGASPASHRVINGQTLSHIAGIYGISVRVIQSANGLANPDRLLLGQVLAIPGTSGLGTHRVARGQTLSHIAMLYRTTVTALKSANGIADPRKLRHGQVVKIP